MKYIKFCQILIIGVALTGSFYGCKKDSYAPPGTTFSGRIVYNGTPLGVKNNGSGTVYFELWQTGFGKSGAIDVFMNQDGSFSSLLFNGQYKLVIPTSQGPFMSIENADTHSDTINLDLEGNKKMDIEVMPYYIFANTSFSLAADSTVSATCGLTQIIKDVNAKSIESVSLFVNRTSFVDDDNNIASSSISGSAITDLSHIVLTTKIPANIAGNTNIGIGKQSYFYARIGVKISGVVDLLFSDIQKISF